MVEQSGPVDLSIIIVNWNSLLVLKDCLESLTRGIDGFTAEVWVVDNASGDDSADYVRSAHPQVRLIANPNNLGFAAANNQAARLSGGRYLLLLNPDTIVPPGSMGRLLSYAEQNPKIGILGPKLEYPDGSPQRSCWCAFPGLKMAFEDAFYLWKLSWLPLTRSVECSEADLRHPLDVAHLLGACILVRREVWLAAGPLDEGFFMYLEETDLCLKAKQLGWRIVYDPDVTIIHLGQHSSHQVPERNLIHLYRSYVRFYRKHYSERKLGLLGLKTIIALASLLRIVMWKVRGLGVRAQDNREHCLKMMAGYQRVLKELPSL
jgi:GT2 family glycosyltransferase